MKRNGYLAAFLVLPLGVAEIVEGHTHSSLAVRGTGIKAVSSDSLAANPHIHPDVGDETVASTVAPVFASGGQHNAESFRVHIVPTGSGFRLIGYPFDPSLYEGHIQRMFGYCPSVDDLAEKLASGLDLPTAQIEAIKRTALNGGTQEIGGYSTSAMRLFSRATLESIGMNFRPPDC